jgi:hypothetical protein
MFNTIHVETRGRCTCIWQNGRSDRKGMFILYEAKANQVKGKFMSAELFVLKILVKLR